MYTMSSLVRHGSAAQKRRFLPRIATGELRMQAFGVSESSSGTDTLSLKTTARGRRRIHSERSFSDTVGFSIDGLQRATHQESSSV
jgi:hypothetical protein